ncbi:MAG: DUF2339 domain-containing protein [Chitinophagaceae bacterium]|nr:DUF2339 domain-containing protein [Chitinophagaceae bacterium]
MEFVLVLLVAAFIIYIAFSRSSKYDAIYEQLKHLTSEIKKLRNEINSLSAEKPSIKKEESSAPIKAPVTPEPPKPVYKEITIVEASPVELVTPKEEPQPEIIEQSSLPTWQPVEEAPVSSKSEGSWWDNWLKNNPDLEKFIGENLFNKIGIAVLVLGIGFFIKYAIDKNWIGEATRIGISLFVGLLLLVLAHLLKRNYRSFSSVLVGGGLAVFYFSFAFAFQEYELISQTTAFVCMVGVTLLGVALAVWYDRMEIAILATVGGFIAPLLVSNGQNNYQALFTYIAILNGGLLVLSFYKRWTILSPVALGFTILLTGGSYISAPISSDPALAKTLFLFYSIFFLEFFGIQVLYNILLKRPFKSIEFIQLLTLYMLYFGAGYTTLEYSQWEQYQGLFSAVLAALSFIAARVFANMNADRNLVQLLTGLSIGLITMAIPIQFGGYTITLFWAVEATLLAWFFIRTQQSLIRYASIILYVFTVVSLISDWTAIYRFDIGPLPIIVNKACLTGLFVVASQLLIYFFNKSKQTKAPDTIHLIWEPVTRLVPILLLFIAGIAEIDYQFNHRLAEAGINGVYLQLWVMLYLILVSQVLPKLGLTIINKAVLIAPGFAAFYYLFSGLYMNSIQEDLFSIGKYQSWFNAYWLIFPMMVWIFYVGIRAFMKEESLRASLEKSYTWFIVFTATFVFSNETKLAFVWLTSNDLASYHLNSQLFQKAGLTIVWALVSFVAIYIGLQKKLKTLRIAALVLFGITLVKLFTYDIQNINPAGKIIAFILLGVLLLVVSFMYQRIKKLLTE